MGKRNNAKNTRNAKNAYEFDQKKSMHYFVVQTVSNNLHHKIFFLILKMLKTLKTKKMSKTQSTQKTFFDY